VKSDAGLSRRAWMAAAAAMVASPWAHADLAEVRQKGVLKVALYKANLPFSDASAQGAVGVEADLAQALAERLKLGVAWLPFDAGETMGDDLRNMVWRGHYLGYGPADLMLQVPIDRHLIEKTPQVSFLLPYYRHKLVWLTKGAPSQSDLRTLNLDGVSLAAEVGTAAGMALASVEGGKYKSAVRLLPSGTEAAEGVVKGRWQAAYVTLAQAEMALKDVASRAEFQITPAALRGTPPNGWAVGMAIKAGQPQLANALNQALQDITADGTLGKIWSKHGLSPSAP
jgi:polar amino acid transport system substrate-binding protein